MIVQLHRLIDLRHYLEPYLRQSEQVPASALSLKGPEHVFTRGEAKAWARMIKRGGRLMTQDNVVDSNLGLTYLQSVPGATDLRAGDIRGRRSQMLHRVF